MTGCLNFWKTTDFPNLRVSTRFAWLGKPKYGVIGMTRIRNEEDVIADTIEHVSKFVDAIIVYDDCSTDRTVSIVKKARSVIRVIENKQWERDRIAQETAHRQTLLEAAREYEPKWLFYFDADERFDLVKTDFAAIPENVDGVRIRLFDAYMTQDDQNGYTPGDKLWGFRKYFGPEYRDILMIFRNRKDINFEGLDAREPTGCMCVQTRNYCQHYGKALSIAQWEETCAYYSAFFPEPYHSKWEARKGKAVHALSDFGRALCTWEEAKRNGIPL